MFVNVITITVITYHKFNFFISFAAILIQGTHNENTIRRCKTKHELLILLVFHVSLQDRTEMMIPCP